MIFFVNDLPLKRQALDKRKDNGDHAAASEAIFSQGFLQAKLFFASLLLKGLYTAKRLIAAIHHLAEARVRSGCSGVKQKQKKALFA